MAHTGRPLMLLEAVVEARRVGRLGHMRAAEYVALFDDAFLAFVRLTGLTDDDLRHGGTSPYLLDLHTCYLKELHAGDRVRVSAQVLEADSRRARMMLFMHPAGSEGPAATCELSILNMDMASRRTAPWSSSQAEIWGELMAAHADLPVPPQAGRAVQSLAARH